jgi:mutator protein MutT
MVKVAVFGVMKRDNQYFLMQRANTGFRDGFYTLPSGHVEMGESPSAALQREVKEEAGVDIDPSNITFVHAMYNTDRYADYYFLISGWKGEPTNAEPEKCSGTRWASLDELESEIVPKVAIALEHIEKNIPFSEVTML